MRYNQTPLGSHPKFSIVVPSYNQADYLDECLTSIASQTDACLELIVCDGGSSDNSIEIIKKRENIISYWYSEADGGQAAALNRGFARAAGHILMWVNSDDLLMPNALSTIGSLWKPGCTLYAGPVEEFEGSSVSRFVRQTALTSATFPHPWRRAGEWHMPGIAFNRETWEAFGPLDQTLRYSFDAEFVGAALTKCSLVRVPSVVARFRRHKYSKTVSELNGFYVEDWKRFKKQCLALAPYDRLLGLAYHYPRYIRARLFQLWMQK